MALSMLARLVAAASRTQSGMSEPESGLESCITTLRSSNTASSCPFMSCQRTSSRVGVLARVRLGLDGDGGPLSSDVGPNIAPTGGGALDLSEMIVSGRVGLDIVRRKSACSTASTVGKMPCEPRRRAKRGVLMLNEMCPKALLPACLNEDGAVSLRMDGPSAVITSGTGPVMLE
ncbi:uncharacterized protein B0I36DRAFT_104622 [Microdochium trichocladiopsis]|uniref:Uncharacterized protein n=1 Tax=Microdochium trichocladiopsis TaxID=1682393 RepID=A0A9P9BRM1_9PEZI|nr:uncharacterized protein B0I36DRAFT_104622 [Microdochium trichocladiopsis]KAH7033071.1 hypothetical protein B0I36DRAFT_104622 [Microdochium trichocladiopsis]